jgi:hypothetical protein
VVSPEFSLCQSHLEAFDARLLDTTPAGLLQEVWRGWEGVFLQVPGDADAAGPGAAFWDFWPKA